MILSLIIKAIGIYILIWGCSPHTIREYTVSWNLVWMWAALVIFKVWQAEDRLNKVGWILILASILPYRLMVRNGYTLAQHIYNYTVIVLIIISIILPLVKKLNRGLGIYSDKWTNKD